MCRRLWLASVLALPLIACVRVYVPPAGGNTATLTIHNLTGGQVTPYALANPDSCSGTQRLLPRSASVGMFPKQVMTIRVPAGKDFSFQVWAKDSIAVGNGYCSVVMTFRPEKDVRYLVGVLTDSQGCAPLVSREIVKPNGEKAFIREASQRVRATRKSVPGRVSCRI